MSRFKPRDVFVKGFDFLLVTVGKFPQSPEQFLVGFGWRTAQTCRCKLEGVNCFQSPLG